MFQIGALFLILNGLVEGIKGRDILFAFLLLLAGVIGKIVCSYISDFSQTRVGYFMCADKRIHVGDRMKYMPMGYFNSHSLGDLTSTVTTTISDVENNAPSVLITVIHGFIHVTVITIVMFFFDWRIGLLACLGIALFLLCNSALQKKSQEVSPKRQAAQEDLVGATLEYIQGMGIVKSFNLGGGSNQKMKQAADLLQNSTLPVSEISERTGFQSLNNFRKIFFKYFNMTPSEYRKTCTTKHTLSISL